MPTGDYESALWDLNDLMKNLKAFLDNLKDDKDDDPVLSDSPQEKDLQPSSSASSQVSHQEPEACQDLPKCKPPGNGDIDQVLEDDEIVEVSTELPHCRARDRPGGGARLDSRESLYLL